LKLNILDAIGDWRSKTTVGVSKLFATEGMASFAKGFLKIADIFIISIALLSKLILQISFGGSFLDFVGIFLKR